MSASEKGDLLDLSTRLRKLMDRDGLTVGEFSSAVGISKSALEKYLSGPSSPRATTIASICAKFDVSADWVMFGKEEESDDHLLSVVFYLYNQSISNLLSELKKSSDDKKNFDEYEFGSAGWRHYISVFSRDRAIEFMANVREFRENYSIGFGPAIKIPGKVNRKNEH